MILACEPGGAQKKRDRTKQMKLSYELLLACVPLIVVPGTTKPLYLD